MQFAKQLRAGIRRGEITTTIRIWTRANARVGGRYQMEGGSVQVTAMREISFDDITEQMAKDSGFMNKLDLLKTAKHGRGETIYFIRFNFIPNEA